MTRMTVWVILVGASLGCAAEPTGYEASECAAHIGAIPLQYVGHAFGEGTLTIERTSEPDAPVAGRVVIDSEGAPQLRLAGPVVCEDGVVRVSFGAADHPEAAVAVMGGTLVAVPPGEASERWFGRWSARVFDKASAQTREVDGFFRERDPDASAPRAEPTTTSGS